MANLSMSRSRTDLAKKYGHPYRIIGGLSHRILKNTGKSGLTPLSPFLPKGLFQPMSVQQRKRQLYYYQQHRYFSFTIAELRQMEALSAFDTRPMMSSLANPMHSMFQRSQWDTDRSLPLHLSFTPILGGHTGFWQVDNPLVWNILDAPLRLASILLETAHFWPWWDALFNGEFRDIEDWRKPPDRMGPLLSFHPRHWSTRNQPTEIEKLRNQIKDAAIKIRFGLSSGYNSVHTGLPMRRQYIFGMTVPSGVNIYRKVWLSIEMLQPLLRNDLTDAERMANYFRIAATAIHECAHAVWDTLEADHPSTTPNEPYYENEPLCEIGWSLEEKLWGGEGKDIVGPEMSEGGPGLPNMGIMKTNWFTELHEEYRPETVNLDHEVVPAGDIDPYFTYDYWPIPVIWQMNLFQSLFWDNAVRPLGSQATQMGPLTYGSRRFAEDRDEAGNYQSIHGPGFTESKYFDGREIISSMTQAEQSYWQFENSRRAHAVTILRARYAGMRAQPHNLDPFMFKDGYIDAFPEDEDTSDEDEDEEPLPSCPRYDEISEYLFENRGPLELALDSMDFDMPEATLYRYIMRRGGLDITTAEFRNFLIDANDRDDLFRFRVQSVTGIITRIDNGWPGITRNYVIPRRTHPSPTDMTNFDEVMTDRNFQHDYYSFFRDFRDIEYDVLRVWINHFLSADNRIRARDIQDIVYQFATNRSGHLALGPEGIARITVLIPQDIKDKVDNKLPSDQGGGSPSPSDSGISGVAKLQEETDLEQFEKESNEGLGGGVDIDSDDDIS